MFFCGALTNKNDFVDLPSSVKFHQDSFKFAFWLTILVFLPLLLPVILTTFFLTKTTMDTVYIYIKQKLGTHVSG